MRISPLLFCSSSADSTLCTRSEVLTVLGTTRSTSILNVFLDALTRGGPNGLPRPIELHAHDPIRYIGDMLAWIHQAMAGEREFLESLFGVKEEGRIVGSVHGYSRHKRTATEVRVVRGETDQDRVKRLLDRDFEGCGRPLKVRASDLAAFQASLTEVLLSADPRATDYQESGEQHHGVSDCDAYSLLQGHDGADHWRRRAYVERA